MGRWTRQDVRRDFLREAATSGACRQAEGRLLLRHPPGALLGGFQSTPLDRRQSRTRSRPAEEARRRAEARLESLFRRDRSPRMRSSSRTSNRDVDIADRSRDGVGTRDRFDTDTPGVTQGSRRRTASGGRGTVSEASVRRQQSSGNRQNTGKTQHSGSASQSGAVATSQHSVPSPQHLRARSECQSAVAYGHQDSSSSSHHRRTSGSPSRPGELNADWSVTKPDSARMAEALLSPDEGEGLTPAPSGAVRIEDFVDTILGEVTSQLERLVGSTPADEDAEHILALYRRQQPPPFTSDCRLARRLRGDRARSEEQSQSSTSQPAEAPMEGEFAINLAPTSAPNTQDSEEFVLQVCTSSQEDADEQDPIRYLQLTEAAHGSTTGTGWLDGSPLHTGGPIRQEDLLLVRSGAVPCRPSSPPPEPSSVGWLEAAVSSPPVGENGWADWRGGGDILDSLDGRRPRWQDDSSVSASSKACVVSDQRCHSSRY